MNFFEFIFQDWKANKGNAKGRIILFLFRIANFATISRTYRYISIPYLIFYRILVEWFFSTEIPWRAKIGRNFRVFHGQALVVSHYAVFGENCTVRQSTTIGVKEMPDGTISGSPVLGNHVDVGSNVCIIGNVHIGDHVKIGCGAVVLKDASPYSVVVGNPGVERKPKNLDLTITYLDEQAKSAV